MQPPLRLALPRPALLLQLAYGGRLHGIIIVEVIIFALSSALQAVASWCGLSRARTPKEALLLKQQRPRRRAAPLHPGHTVDLRERWRRTSGKC